VVVVGTGKYADVPGYLVGGKTGTADKEKGGRYAAHANLASFVSVFPVSDPRYAVLVMVDEPKGNAFSHGYSTGGWVSAPAVGQIIARMAPLEGLMPIPADAPESQNPLVAMVPDYDSPASKKSHSLVMEVKATAGSPAAPKPSTGEPLEAE
jgi:cell division protein FtsI (penicillin-binding protein 3)